MDWLNLHIPTVIRSPEFVGSSPAERGTWLCVMAYAATIECGGVLTGAAEWKDRQWQQAAGVTHREVRLAFRLLRVEASNIIVNGYPVDKEAQVRQARGIAKAGAMARWGNAGRAPAANAATMPTGIKSAMPDGNAEGEGEGEGKENISLSPSASGESSSESLPLVLDSQPPQNSGPDTPDEIYAAYPRRVGKQAALKAISAAVRRLNTDDTMAGHVIAKTKLMRSVQAYAAAVATWPEADRQFVPHPATWFNRGSYDDDPAAWQRKGATTGPASAPREYPGMRPDDPILTRRNAF